MPFCTGFPIFFMERVNFITSHLSFISWMMLPAARCGELKQRQKPSFQDVPLRPAHIESTTDLLSLCRVPNVLHQAQVSWRWKQSCRCIHLFCFVYFDNIPFLNWQHSHILLPINLHLKAGEYRRESSKKKSQCCKLTSWKKEKRSKEDKGSCQLKPKNCKNFQ